MRTASHQQPWLATLIEHPDLERWVEPLTMRADAHGFDRCLIRFGADHGFWREERAFALESEAWRCQIDSHRPGPSVPLEPDEPTLAHLFKTLSLLVQDPWPGSLRLHQRWLIQGGRRSTLEQPLLAFERGKVPAVVQGFGLQAPFWKG